MIGEKSIGDDGKILSNKSLAGFITGSVI